MGDIIDLEGGVIEVEAIVKAVAAHRSLEIRNGTVQGSLLLSRAAIRKLRVVNVVFPGDIKLRKSPLEILEILDSEIRNIEVDRSSLISLYVCGCNLRTIDVVESDIGSFEAHSSNIKESFFALKTAFKDISIIHCNMRERVALELSHISGNLTLGATVLAGRPISFDASSTKLFGICAVNPATAAGKVLLPEVVQGLKTFAEDVASHLPSQRPAPLSVEFADDHFVALPEPVPAEVNDHRLADIHAHLREEALRVVDEFVGNQRQLAASVTIYVQVLGETIERMQRYRLEAAGLVLQAHADNAYEDGRDILMAEQRMLLQGLLALHAVFTTRIADIQAFRHEAEAAALGDDALPLAIEAADTLATSMEQASDKFDPEIPATLRQLSEALRSPGRHAKVVAFALIRSIENVTSAVASYLLRIGKQTFDQAADEISDKSAKALARVAQGVIIGGAVSLAALSAKIPALSWLHTVVTYFQRLVIP